MRDKCPQIKVVFIYCFVFSAIACLAQKPAAKPDDWAMQNASIGAVEIAAGALPVRCRSCIRRRMARRFR
jgi:hypothetical protein